MDATTVIGENDQRSNVQAIQVINNDAGKDAMLQAVIAEILNHVVDMACKKCMSFDYFVDRFNIVDSTNYRSNRGLSESAFSVQSDSDTSDEEFERILESTRRHTSLQQEEEDDDTEVAIPVKGNEKFIEHEYDAMPALEELRIHVEEDILLEQFGKIVNIVDRLVVIEADTNTALDFDTVIFDVDRNAVGRVFDIFGPVVKPMYAILFNDIKEANQWKVNSAMYYAPAAAQFTHRIFTEKLRQQMRCREKATDGCWDGEGECPDDMLAFSDDETEQRYKAKHRSIKVRSGSQHACGGPRNKKARYSSKRGRSAYQNNRLYITRQFGNGSEYIQHGDNSAPYLYSAGSSLEQDSTHQRFWPLPTDREQFRRFQSDSRLTSRTIEQSNPSFFERNIGSRQHPSFLSFPWSDEISLQSMNNSSTQFGTLNSSFDRHSHRFSNSKRL